MDNFEKFDNTLGFFVGNEVIALANQSSAAPYIKAAARDMKAYRDAKGYRKIPVGYCAADIAELRPMLQNYLACGTNSSETIDFFGLNAYEWCGNVDFNTSGYSNLNDQAAGYSLPIFFSETGCNKPTPRDFADQSAVLGPLMTDRWSGAIVYEWIEEANNYGLISYGPALAPTATGAVVVGGYTRSGTPTPVLPDFTNLQSQWKSLSPTGTPSSAYSPNVTPPACPASTAGGWLVDPSAKLPTLNQVLITSAPTASGTAGAGTGAGSATASSASATATKGSASGSKEIAGMSAGLVAVMMGFMYWL
jgi:1,3-beta-glucanosyltransferase GAS1